MRKNLVAIVMFVMPFVAMAATSVDEFMTMSVDKQRQLLQEVGYREGGEVGDIDAMKAYADALHKKYTGINLGVLPKSELLLLTELTKTDHILNYFTQDKDVMLRGCQMGVELAKYLSPGEAFEVHTGCNYKTKGLTAEESEKVKRLVVNQYETINYQASETNDPRKNVYLADSGRYMCAANIDCKEGAKRMYRALLDEYVTKGVDGFDKAVWEATDPLFNYLLRSKNFREYFAFRQLEYEEYQDGKLPKNNGYYRSVSELADEFRPDAKHYPEVAEILSDIDSGRNILEMEAERYRRDPASFLIDAPNDVYVEVAKAEPAAEPYAASAVQKPEPKPVEKAVATKQEPVVESRSMMPAWLVIGGTALLILLLGGYALYRRRKSDD